MTRFFFALLVLSFSNATSQSLDNLVLKGNYTSHDSSQIVDAYYNAYQAVMIMEEKMQSIWNAQVINGESKEAARKRHWEAEAAFLFWLGKPDKIRKSKRYIERMAAKFDKTMILEVTKKNRGRCKGWISAWTIPHGQIRIRLCEDYFIYRTHLQEKVLIHEIGHEAGMFFHHRIHGCWSARRAAASWGHHMSKKSPENYAWLAMSYVGLVCDY